MPVGFSGKRAACSARIVAPSTAMAFHAWLVELEHDIAPRWRHGVVEMHDGARRACHAFEGFFDQIAARLREALDHHVIGDAAAVDEITDKIEIGRAGARESRPRFP